METINNNINNGNLNNAISAEKFFYLYKKLLEEKEKNPFKDFIEYIIPLIKAKIDTNDYNEIIILNYKKQLLTYLNTHLDYLCDRLYDKKISLFEYKHYIEILKMLLENNINLPNFEMFINALNYAYVRETGTIEYNNYKKLLLELTKKR